MDKNVALKLLNSQVSLYDLILKPVPYRNRCFTFISISQLFDTIEEALRTLSSNISYIIIWVYEDTVILDIPDIDAKVVFHDANSQVFLDVLEDICKNYTPEVIIYN